MFGNGANASFWKFLSQKDIFPLEIRVKIVPPWILLHNIEACMRSCWFCWLCREINLKFRKTCDRAGTVKACLLNRPVALRDHVTNASFKRCVGILLMPKIDRAHKNYLTPEIWKETHLREIFYGSFIFQQSSMICIGRHVGGHTLALQHGGQNYFLLISC